MSLLGLSLVVLGVKATLVLLLAFGAAAALRRQPAVAHHRIWVGTFSGLLTLPLVMAALPGWEILPVASAVPAVERALPGPGASGSALALRATGEVTGLATQHEDNDRRVVEGFSNVGSSQSGAGWGRS